MTPSERTPWWLWPNLLSLDAPLVAVAWLYMLAKTWRVVVLPGAEYVVLALVVWIIYVGDRLLDAAVQDGSARIRPRHQFHARHRRVLGTLAAVAAGVVLWLVLKEGRMAIRGYVAVAGFLAAGYFAMAVFAVPESGDISYSKNILGGLAFAFGTAMFAHVYMFDEGVIGLLFNREFIAFAMLCILNIAAIDLWEHSGKPADEEAGAPVELAVTLPLLLLGAVSFYLGSKSQDMGSKPFFFAILTGAALLFVLNRVRGRLSQDAVRVLADVALLVPLPVFIALR